MHIYDNVKLNDKNWFQTGGTARYFCQPSTSTEIQLAIEFAKTKNIKALMLGEGANVLISDNGIDGLVINPRNNNFEIIDQSNTHSIVRIGAGMSITDAINMSLSHRLCGLEEFSGIPGTIGGSTFINVHYFKCLLSHYIVKANVIRLSDNKIFEVDNSWFEFGYDTSALHRREYVVVDVTFKLVNATETEVNFALGRNFEIIRHREQRYPTSHTCGSFFKNFSNEEVAKAKAGPKVIYVAYYLDQLGFKGILECGDAIISHRHANMIFNRKNCSSNDIIELAKAMQKKVFDVYALMPQPECQLLGFNTWPLLGPEQPSAYLNL